MIGFRIRTVLAATSALPAAATAIKVNMAQAYDASNNIKFSPSPPCD